MSYDNEAIQAAEQILKDALSNHTQEQIKEHQSAMPWLANACAGLLPQDQLGTINDKVHIYAIRKVQDATPTDDLANPMNLDIDTATVARLEHMHSFETDEEVHECLNNMSASIVANEGSKLHHNKELAFFMSIRNQWFVLYAARRITVSKRCGADFTTATGSMGDMENTPDKFFQNFPDMTKDTQQHIIDLIFFTEAAKLMEKRMPAVYKTMAQRIMNQLEDNDGE